ncbi:MAG TPA: ATP-binding protein [Gemmatimonadales bacterium]
MAAGSSLENVGRQYVIAVGAVALTTAIGFGLRSALNPIDVAMLYLLAVVAVSAGTRRGPALLATLLGTAAFDLVFVPPYYTFAVHDTSYLLTFGVMLAVALTMSSLTGRIRVHAAEAEERATRAAALHALDRELTGAEDTDTLLAVAARHLGQVVGGTATVVLAGAGGTAAWPSGGAFEDIGTRLASAWALERGEAAGLGTLHGADADALVLPLRVSARVMGVVIIRPDEADQPVTPAARRTAEELANALAAALERVVLAERHEQARVDVESERLRTALLSSLSHDMRTPLGSIEGAASSLLEDTSALPPETRRELAQTILEESRRMNRLIANLLDMIKVESGTLAVQKAWQPLEEPLGVALLRLEDRLAGHPVETLLPGDLPLVPIDELLIEQVFINLLENAVKYTPPGTPVSVRAWPEGDAVVVEVADRGPGIPPAERADIFRKFYRGSSADDHGRTGGSGLGLTICQGIVVAHGGRLWVDERPGGGAVFRFTLPIDGGTPEPPPAEPNEAR